MTEGWGCAAKERKQKKRERIKIRKEARVVIRAEVRGVGKLFQDGCISSY